MSKLLTIKNLNKTYLVNKESIPVLNNINLEINNNEIIAIVGKSGCGKSTLLSIICELLNYDSGTIIKHQELIYGYMLQTDTLLPWLTIKDNALLGLKIKKQLTNESDEKLNELLEKYHLIDYQDKYPSSLSGGMKERLALIRTIMINPDILLLDEPMSSLDYQTKRMVANDLYTLIKAMKKSAIIVTHDLEEAVSLADRIIILSDKPSTILKEVMIDHQNLSYDEFRKSEFFLKYTNEVWEAFNEI